MMRSRPAGRGRMAELKEILRDQALLLRLDEERAVAAIPKLAAARSERRARGR